MEIIKGTTDAAPLPSRPKRRLSVDDLAARLLANLGQDYIREYGSTTPKKDEYLSTGNPANKKKKEENSV